jgi:hypothetical protein
MSKAKMSFGGFDTSSSFTFGSAGVVSYPQLKQLIDAIRVLDCGSATKSVFRRSFIH